MKPEIKRAFKKVCKNTHRDRDYGTPSYDGPMFNKPYIAFMEEYDLQTIKLNEILTKSKPTTKKFVKAEDDHEWLETQLDKVISIKHIQKMKMHVLHTVGSRTFSSNKMEWDTKFYKLILDLQKDKEITEHQGNVLYSWGLNYS